MVINNCAYQVIVICIEAAAILKRMQYIILTIPSYTPNNYII